MRNKIYLPLLVALLCLAAWTTHAQLQRNTQANFTPYSPHMDYRDYITIDPNKRGGKP